MCVKYINRFSSQYHQLSSSADINSIDVAIEIGKLHLNYSFDNGSGDDSHESRTILSMIGDCSLYNVM